MWSYPTFKWHNIFILDLNIFFKGTCKLCGSEEECISDVTVKCVLRLSRQTKPAGHRKSIITPWAFLFLLKTDFIIRLLCQNYCCLK